MEFLESPKNMAATEKDSETGEYNVSTESDDASDSSMEYDNETGEFDATITSLRLRKTAKFSIPKNLIAPQDDPRKCCCIDPNDTFTLTKKEDVITLQEEIILGCNKTSHRLFLIVASMFFFTRICAVLAVLIELSMHCWAHKKNSRNSNPNIYYRSPLHVFTSQFCIVCRHETSMDQVIKLQDQRSKHWRLNLKNVAKNIY
ncbi:hypothetical protein HA402_002904 [Bradysia odoriphaga]|nr:hypothetical protein HA402_002904 [Bradysia odoriphaga]